MIKKSEYAGCAEENLKIRTKKLNEERVSEDDYFY